MRYRIVIERRAQGEIASLPWPVLERIEAKILALGDEPRPPGCVKLRNREGWRVRVGDYRVIYDIADDRREIIVRRVTHRRDAYRG